MAKARDRQAPVSVRIGLIIGPVLAVAAYLLLPADLAHPARVTAGVTVLMAIWWMTEAIPIPATALLPLLTFPVLIPEVSVNDVGANYGNSVIFLFLGGFLIALTMQRWNLHRRIALTTISAAGDKSVNIIGGFMVATAFLSMWVSNTATAIMMLPIGVSVIALLVPRKTNAGDGDPVTDSRFGTAMMLGIAYAASIGSIGTIIGTPPNVLLVGYLEEDFDIVIGFGQWMLAAVPLVIVFLVIAWLLLTRVLFRPEVSEIPGGRAVIREERSALGSMTAAEKRVGLVFLAAIAGWVVLPLVWPDAPLSDAGVALIAAIALFLIPSGTGERMLDWATALKVPWGVLLLFGGGLALSRQFSTSGLTDWIAVQAQALGTFPVLAIVFSVVVVIVVLTEITSNTATAATFLPVSGGIALGLGLSPMVLAIPVALAASAAFMLPVATPPNAIAYGSGYVTVASMIKGGVWLNIIGIVLITITTMTLMQWLLISTFT